MFAFTHTQTVEIKTKSVINCSNIIKYGMIVMLKVQDSVNNHNVFLRQHLIAVTVLSIRKNFVQ